jgi:LemA protein
VARTCSKSAGWVDIPLSTSVVSLIVAAVLVFWALGAYNRLVRLRAQVVRSLQDVTQIWRQQVSQISAQLEQYSQGSESESQWAGLAEDAPRWRPLTLSARQFLACLKVLEAKPHTLAAFDDVSAVRAARDVFESHWHQLQVEKEDLAGAPVPHELKLIWVQHEASVLERLRDYHAAVEAYHQAIGQFPALLLAGLFGFGKTARFS